MSSAVTTPGTGERRLTPQERRLVEVIVEAASEGKALTRGEAGKLAGYGGTDESARVQASRALARPEVRNALINGIREAAQSDVGSSYAVIRHLTDRAESGRVKLDAAREHLLIAGVRAADEGPRGPAVAIQVVFQHGGGARLAQLTGQAVEAQAISHVQPVEHSLAEGEGARARRSAPLPGGQPQAAEAPPGVKKPRARPPAGPSSPRAPENPRGKNSGSGKSRGGSGG